MVELICIVIFHYNFTPLKQRKKLVSDPLQVNKGNNIDKWYIFLTSDRFLKLYPTGLNKDHWSF